jgi:hypothetical protein
MAILDLMVNKTSEERTEIKTNAIYDKVQSLSTTKQWSFKDPKGRTVKIEKSGIGELIGDTVVLSLKKTSPIWFKISVDGKYLNGDGWYGFVNPPIMIPDGTFSTTQKRDEKLTVSNFKEDILEATKQIILQVLEGS